MGVNAQSLQDVLKNLDCAFTNFFRGHSSYPTFKSLKRSKLSAKFPQRNQLLTDKGLLVVTKFQEGIKIIVDRIPKGELRNVVISKSKTGKYTASLTYETGRVAPAKKPISDNAVGIDLGIKHFATLSPGEKIVNHKFLKSSQDRLVVLQRRLSKKVKGSHRRKVQVLRVAKVHEKIIFHIYLHLLTL